MRWIIKLENNFRGRLSLQCPEKNVTWFVINGKASISNLKPFTFIFPWKMNYVDNIFRVQITTKNQKLFE